MTQFKIKEKQISVYPCDEPDRPVIYLNTFELSAVYARICQRPEVEP